MLDNVVEFKRATNDSVKGMQPVFFYAANRAGFLEYLRGHSKTPVQMLTFVFKGGVSRSAHWQGDTVKYEDLEQITQALTTEQGEPPQYFGCYYINSNFTEL